MAGVRCLRWLLSTYVLAQGFYYSIIIKNIECPGCNALSLSSAESYFVDEIVNHGFGLLQLLGGAKRGYEIFKNFMVPGLRYSGITVTNGRFGVKVVFEKIINPVSEGIGLERPGDFQVQQFARGLQAGLAVFKVRPFDSIVAPQPQPVI